MISGSSAVLRGAGRLTALLLREKVSGSYRSGPAAALFPKSFLPRVGWRTFNYSVARQRIAKVVRIVLRRHGGGAGIRTYPVKRASPAVNSPALTPLPADDCFRPADANRLHGP